MTPVTWKVMVYLLGVLVLSQAGALAWASESQLTPADLLEFEGR